MRSLELFCRQIRDRSTEHRKAIQLLQSHRLLSQVLAILRQELDSMFRVIFLLSIGDRTVRQQMIDDSVAGERWTVPDAQMVQFARARRGWVESVYKFGCASIHLSMFHDYKNRDPFLALSRAKKADILRHMRRDYPEFTVAAPTFQDLVPYFPKVFEKIARNLEIHVKELEASEAPA